MRGINNVILIGNATRDTELRHTQNGKAVSSIRLANN
jgi:single-stranded DNA-binding protein